MHAVRDSNVVCHKAPECDDLAPPMDMIPPQSPTSLSANSVRPRPAPQSGPHHPLHLDPAQPVFPPPAQQRPLMSPPPPMTTPAAHTCNCTCPTPAPATEDSYTTEILPFSECTSAESGLTCGGSVGGVAFRSSAARCLHRPTGAFVPVQECVERDCDLPAAEVALLRGKRGVVAPLLEYGTCTTAPCEVRLAALLIPVSGGLVQFVSTIAG